MLAVFAIPVFIMGLYPLILSLFGEVFFKGAYIALLGFFVLGAALIAICMFMSTLTESQVISAVISFGVLLVMYMMNGLSTTVPTSPIASYICFFVLSIALGVVFWLLTRDYVISAIAAVVCLIPLNIFYFTNNAAFGGLFFIMGQELRVIQKLLYTLIESFLVIFRDNTPLIILSQHFLHAGNFNSTNRSTDNQRFRGSRRKSLGVA